MLNWPSHSAIHTYEKICLYTLKKKKMIHVYIIYTIYLPWRVRTSGVKDTGDGLEIHVEYFLVCA